MEPPLAAVAAVGAAERFELLAVYRGAAVSAVAGLGVNHHTVDEAGHEEFLPSNVKLSCEDSLENSLQLHIRGKSSGD